MTEKQGVGEKKTEIFFRPAESRTPEEVCSAFGKARDYGKGTIPLQSPCLYRGFRLRRQLAQLECGRTERRARSYFGDAKYRTMKLIFS